MIRYIIIYIILFSYFFTFSQDREYALSIVEKLTSNEMHGRGYVSNGDKKAATFIKKEFKNIGLHSINKEYFQKFNISINTFPKTVNITLNGSKLTPGKDFVVSCSSPTISGTFDLVWVLSGTAESRSLDLEQQKKNDFTNKIIVTDLNEIDFHFEDYPNAKGVIFLVDKLWWHVSNGRKVNDYVVIKMNKDMIPKSAIEIQLNFKNKFHESYTTQNVIGLIKGTSKSDSCIVLTAHYDHLGKMGSEIFFPGGNDNASGIGLILDLARYFSKPNNQAYYNIVFIAFSAEEVGLLGSNYFVQNSLIPLTKIKFLINLDMVGSGSDGIKVVNGSVFEDHFSNLAVINKSNNYLVKVSPRGEAANSDHYPFYTNGVPCFFIYTLGKECPEYHTINDNINNVPYTKYDDLFMLIVDFVDTL